MSPPAPAFCRVLSHGSRMDLRDPDFHQNETPTGTHLSGDSALEFHIGKSQSKGCGDEFNSRDLQIAPLTAWDGWVVLILFACSSSIHSDSKVPFSDRARWFRVILEGERGPAGLINPQKALCERGDHRWQVQVYRGQALLPGDSRFLFCRDLCWQGSRSCSSSPCIWGLVMGRYCCPHFKLRKGKV
jgi:hypothetical protein